MQFDSQAKKAFQDTVLWHKKFLHLCILLLLFSWPPFREVCPNYEVVMFLPCTDTPLDLGTVDNFYIAIILIPSLPFYAFHLMSARGEATHSVPFPLSPDNYNVFTQDHFPPRRHLSPSQHKEANRSLHQATLPPLLTHPHRACCITNAAPWPPSKYHLKPHSADSNPPFSDTTAHGASPLPLSPYTCRKSQVLASMPPTPPLFPASCQCMSPVSELPLP